MTTTSADPERLGAFVRGARGARDGLESRQRALTSLYASVHAACGYRRIDCASVGALATLLDGMEANERFVATVRTELLAADSTGSGTVTIDSAVIDNALLAAGVGRAPAAVEFDPAVMVGLPPTSGYVDDPICAANGNMVHQDTDVEFPAIAGALTLTRTWNSLRHRQPGAFGPGWSSVLDVRLAIGDGVVRAHLADGAIVPFVPVDDSADGRRWEVRGRRGLTLTEIDEGFELDVDPVRSFRFDGSGALLGWRSGVAEVTVTRNDHGRVIGLHEQRTGRSLAVHWAGGYVESVTTDDGRTVSYERTASATIATARSHAGSLRYVWHRETMLRSVVDADGVAAFVNEYDDAARVLRQTSPHGRRTQYHYEAGGSAVITGDDGVQQAMIHDARGNLTAVVDHDGSVMRIEYDDADRAVRVTERDGAVWHYEYDERDDLVRRVDPDGGTQTWAWDDRHRVVATTDRAGATTRMEYDTDHQAPTRVIGPDGGISTQVLDDRGLPLEITDPDGVVTRFRWDRDGQLVSTTDALGNETRFDHDAHGLLTGLVPPAGAATHLQRGDDGRVQRSIRGDAVASWTYTPAGRITAGVEPGDVPWSATFGAHGDLETFTDGTGATVEMRYDSLGNVVEVVAPDGAVYASTYDAVGRHVSASDPSGATVTKGYDQRGRLVSFTDAEGGTWIRELDVLGRTVASTAPDGRTTRWMHHPRGEVASVTTPDGRVWTVDVDVAGRPVAVTDPTGARSEIGYTPAGRLAWRRSPAGRTESFEYDAAGRLVATVDPDGTRRELSLDPLGRVVAVEDAEGRLELSWDDEHHLAEAALPGGGTATYERDAGGRVRRFTDPTGTSTRFEWDERGLPSTAFDPAGIPTRFRHDQRGRLQGIDSTGDRTLSLDYGIDGRLAQVSDPTGVTTAYRRDANGRMTGLRHRDGSGWDRTLDPVGRELSRTSTEGDVTQARAYDAAGRISAATVEDLTTEFLWDDADRLTSVTGVDGGTTRIERDLDGWVVGLVDVDSGERTTFERDGRGRITRVSVDGEGVDVPTRSELPRDLAGRLAIGADGTAYRYDDSGRLAEVLPQDEPATTYAYDDDGLVAVETGPGGIRHFTYDAAGRVVAVRVEGVGTTDIEYDSRGRRVLETRPDRSTVRYGWDALDRLASIETRRWPDDDEATRLTIRYDALDRPVLVDGDRVDHDPVTGQVRRLGDRRFVPVDSIAYDTATRSWQEPGPRRPLGGTPAGPVWILGARVLDPATHQFLSPDPLLPVAGTNGASSAYTYAWQDPVNHVDPRGLRPVSMEEYDAIRQREEQGRVGQAYQAIREDPWGSLATVGVVAAGVGLMFVPGGQVVGAGILIGAAAGAGIGFATGNFSPTGVAVSGAFGAIPGGSTMRSALTVGAATGAGETVVTSALTGQGFPSGRELVFGTVTGSAVGGGAHRLTSGLGSTVDDLVPARSTAALDHAPTA
ncbi:MAG TPA: DUF6531 domain-containing protein, partial [Acidimicrobiales bacterium]|nr:DUF6531 domain-containing protein [Acidimicrobiales bacterium]